MIKDPPTKLSFSPAEMRLIGSVMTIEETWGTLVRDAVHAALREGVTLTRVHGELRPVMDDGLQKRSKRISVRVPADLEPVVDRLRGTIDRSTWLRDIVLRHTKWRSTVAPLSEAPMAIHADQGYTIPAERT